MKEFRDHFHVDLSFPGIERHTYLLSSPLCKEIIQFVPIFFVLLLFLRTIRLEGTVGRNKVCFEVPEDPRRFRMREVVKLLQARPDIFKIGRSKVVNVSEVLQGCSLRYIVVCFVH